ncbi:MAG: EF-hand domain-containing protein [Planctomycetes bacterium]|nr:EF-hand domain-containing protein [Planctomycetota bacterium]
MLVLEEFVANRGNQGNVQKAGEVFAIVDRDGNGKLTLEEFTTRPREARFREHDNDGDGGLDLKEFQAADMKGAEAARVQRVFTLADKDGDMRVSSEEFFGRPKEAWFHRMDADGDQRMSLEEYGQGTPGLVQSGHIQRAFVALDRDGDSSLEPAEYCRNSPEVIFLTRDSDGDGQLRPEEFSGWCADAEATKKRFARRDSDGNAQLSFKECHYDPNDVHFWALDQDGDYRVSSDEFEGAIVALPGTVSEGDPASGSVVDRRNIFERIDTNGDGLLCWDEFRSQPQELRFRMMDLNGNSVVSLPEFLGPQASPEEVTEAGGAFRAKDKDTDGNLTLDEYTGGKRN